MKRTRRLARVGACSMLGVCTTLLVPHAAAAPKDSKDEVPPPPVRHFFVEAGVGYSKAEFFGELAPPSVSRPAGGVGNVAVGLLWKSLGFGPRLWGGLFSRGTTAWGIGGEISWRVINGGLIRLTARFSGGYARVNAINLEQVGLGTYGGGGFDFGAGPTFTWQATKDFAIGLGARFEMIFLTRPPLGPCDDAHGCDGVFYPDERGEGGIGFLDTEITATQDF